MQQRKEVAGRQKQQNKRKSEEMVQEKQQVDGERGMYRINGASIDN